MIYLFRPSFREGIFHDFSWKLDDLATIYQRYPGLPMIFPWFFAFDSAKNLLPRGHIGEVPSLRPVRLKQVCQDLAQVIPGVSGRAMPSESKETPAEKRKAKMTPGSGFLHDMDILPPIHLESAIPTFSANASRLLVVQNAFVRGENPIDRHIHQDFPRNLPGSVS